MKRPVYLVATATDPAALVAPRSKPDDRTAVLLLDDLVQRLEQRWPELPLTVIVAEGAVAAVARRHPGVEVAQPHGATTRDLVAELSYAAFGEEAERATFLLLDRLPYLALDVIHRALAPGPGARLVVDDCGIAALLSVDEDTLTSAVLALTDDASPYSIGRAHTSVARGAGLAVLAETVRLELGPQLATACVGADEVGDELGDWLRELSGS